MDAVNLLPAAVLFAIGAVLFAVLHGHPNWPSEGYLVIAVGALATLLGMFARRPRPVTRPASSGP